MFVGLEGWKRIHIRPCDTILQRGRVLCHDCSYRIHERAIGVGMNSYRFYVSFGIPQQPVAEKFLQGICSGVAIAQNNANFLLVREHRSLLRHKVKKRRSFLVDPRYLVSDSIHREANRLTEPGKGSLHSDSLTRMAINSPQGVGFMLRRAPAVDEGLPTPHFDNPCGPFHRTFRLHIGPREWSDRVQGNHVLKLVACEGDFPWIVKSIDSREPKLLPLK